MAYNLPRQNLPPMFAEAIQQGVELGQGAISGARHTPRPGNPLSFLVAASSGHRSRFAGGSGNRYAVAQRRASRLRDGHGVWRMHFLNR